jgi:hypothetical protein
MIIGRKRPRFRRPRPQTAEIKETITRYFTASLQQIALTGVTIVISNPDTWTVGR